ncbi:MAG: ribose 5-phosphate isomerase B [Coriobacteriales bacterium]|nr:ribose 5-phosphate isomerase B [Coriobacteriales bacterium]
MSEPLRLALGADHAGFEQKTEMATWLKSLGFEVLDLGSYDDGRVDYPDYAVAVSEKLQSGQADLGILLCGTGIGMAIAANKCRGIRAANALNTDFARLAREHNAANVLTLSARFVDLPENQAIVQAFLEAEPLGERHAERVEKINSLDK